MLFMVQYFMKMAVREFLMQNVFPHITLIMFTDVSLIEKSFYDEHCKNDYVAYMKRFTLLQNDQSPVSKKWHKQIGDYLTSFT